MSGLPSSESSERGFSAERAAARKFDLAGVEEKTGYFDLYASNGVRYQVKSCQHTRSNGNPGKLRFWREHFEKLTADRSGVIVVLTASTNPEHVLKIEKVPTSRVAEEIGEKWYPSGHADEGEQYKLPWRDLLSYG